MRIVPFQPEHMRCFEPALGAVGSHWLKSPALMECLVNNPSFSLLDKAGEVVGAGGIMILWPGAGEAWLMTNPQSSRHAVHGFKVMRTLLDQMQMNLRLVRVQSILYNASLSFRIARLLGFEPEFKMQHYYGWNQHGVMATRIRKEVECPKQQ